MLTKLDQLGKTSAKNMLLNTLGLISGWSLQQLVSHIWWRAPPQGTPPPSEPRVTTFFFLWNTSICFQTCRLTCHTINSSQFLPTRDFHFMCFFRPHMLLLKVVFKRQASCLLHATQLGRSSFYSC